MKYKNYEIESWKSDNVYYLKIDDVYIEKDKYYHHMMIFKSKEDAIEYGKEIIDKFKKESFKFETSTYIQRITKRGYIIGEHTTKGDGIFFQKQKNSSTWYWKPIGINSLLYKDNYEVKYTDVVGYDKNGVFIKRPINGKFGDK